MRRERQRSCSQWRGAVAVSRIESSVREPLMPLGLLTRANLATPCRRCLWAAAVAGSLIGAYMQLVWVQRACRSA